ncbi:MAG: hypothetical protein AAFY71_02490 [Bacteroidota bacterium]
MINQSKTQLLKEKFGVDFNHFSIEELFQKYEETGFIYPAKKEILQPHMAKISENWRRLKESKEDLLWYLTCQDEEKGYFSSVTAWRHSNNGMVAQHLISNGNPFLSLKVMMAAQTRAQFPDYEITSSQNWFRQNNRYAFRVFASMTDRLGPKTSSLNLFQYLHLKLEDASQELGLRYHIEEVIGPDQDLVHLVEDRYGEVFVKGEELDQDDILLNESTQSFAQYGLSRYRKIYKFMDKDSGKIAACIIANRAPLGLNFSFIENRCYFIISKEVELEYRNELVMAMARVAKVIYQDLELGVIPIVTDLFVAAELKEAGAIPIREYMQSIWLKDGFQQWYDHIESFWKKIEGRLSSKVA